MRTGASLAQSVSRSKKSPRLFKTGKIALGATPGRTWEFGSRLSARIRPSRFARRAMEPTKRSPARRPQQDGQTRSGGGSAGAFLVALPQGLPCPGSARLLSRQGLVAKGRGQNLVFLSPGWRWRKEQTCSGRSADVSRCRE
jgi:hypothetical protein